MFELLVMSILGAAYVGAHIKEAKEENLVELKTKVFQYAICKGVSYNSVVEDIQNKKLSFDDIDNFLKGVN